MLRTCVVVVAILGMVLVWACGEGEESAELTAVPSPTASPTSPTATGTVAPSPTIGPATPTETPEASVPVGKIVFNSRRTGDYELFLLTPEGEVRLTNDPAEDENPDLSPDGEKVVFASNREDGYHIYVMNVDGSGLTKLTDHQFGDHSPRWSPDGERIAFSRAGAIMVMEADGSNVQEVTEPNPTDSAPPCEGGAFLGGWSPDGEQLTFYAAVASRSVGQVCTVNADGSDLTVVVSEPPGFHVEPSWSPDGEWIAYRSIREKNHEIHKVKPDGTSDTNLTNNPATDLEPAWSPDGKWIVFGSDRDSVYMDLYIMNADGSNVARLTTDPGKDSDPSWGP